MRAILFTLSVVFAMTVSAQPLPYQDSSLSAYERAKDLCSRLTIEEKTSLMMDRSPAIERLGIPQFHWWNEALHGVGRNGYATVFPATIGMAASFDDALLYDIFTAVSDEARAKNTLARKNPEIKRYQGLSFWTPNINIFRDPRWGRGQETYGEDPFLTSRMGLAVVAGLQGDLFFESSLGVRKSKSYIQLTEKPKYRKLLACAKHFAVHSGPEWNRHSFNVESLPERDLWETYLPAFKSLVQEGKVAEIMCAYQQLEGEPCCGNTRLLHHILRDEWGFQGLITSDCGAIDDFWMPNRHGFTKNDSESTAKAIRAGTDVECGSQYNSLPEALKAGEITIAEVDTSLIRLLTARFELGDFDKDEENVWTTIPMTEVASIEHKSLALQMARESVVLLQNKNHILPLSKHADNIVVMGPNAEDSIMQRANYAGTPTATTTILQGIRSKIGDVKYIQGCGHTRNDTIKGAIAIEDILNEIGEASTIVFVGGISPALEGEEMPVSEVGFSGGDRTDIELPQVQRDLISQLHRAGKRVVFVNCSGSAIALVPESQNADAILQVWYPGEKGGEAVADVLFGDYNPSGKLPLTFYKHTQDLPDFLEYKMANRTYRYFRGEPLYAFGYGESYTTFKLSKPKVKDGKLTVNVKNTGKVKGTEVVQLYVRKKGDVMGPLKSLRGFQRVTLLPGQKHTICFSIDEQVLENWDPGTNTMRTTSGEYELFVGNSSRDTDLHRVSVTL